MRRALVVSGLTVASAFLACKPRQDGSQVLNNSTNPNETAVDVNDLSYLLPRNANGEIYPEIRVVEGWNDTRLRNKLQPFDDGGANPVLTKAVYDSIVQATSDQKNFGSKPNSTKTPFTATDNQEFEHDAFVITSFRIDPCAPSLALDKDRTNYQNPLSQSVIGAIVAGINQEIASIFAPNAFTLSACQTQLRLILQPLTKDKKTILESTIHMVYTLNGGAGVMNDTLQADVQGLKKKLQDVTGVDTTGYLLQPHPGLASEAASNQDATRAGPGGQAVVDYLSTVLHKFNNSQVMAVIRERVVNGIQYDVVLGGGVSDPRETATYAAGPLVGSAARKGFIITSNADRRSWRMDPQPTRNTPVFDNLITFDPERIDSPQESTLLNMMKKDDPESTHFFVNDCVTCHGTSQAFRQIQDQSIAAATAPRYRVPAGVSGFPIGSLLPPAPSGSGDKVVGVMLRNFGYSHGQPIVGLRTVTETAALADYFNRDLRRIKNPGAACAGESEQKAWIAAITMGTSESNPPYQFTKGKGTREDALFAAAGCATAVVDANLGTRGDGQNTPKVGTQQSPIFSQMSFEGQSAAGPMTLTLAKMGQAVISKAPAGASPELMLGTWTYVADPVTRLSQIKVNFDGGQMLMAMNGVSLCEVLAKDQKATVNGCLSIQSNWVKTQKAATLAGSGPVAFFAAADCKGTPEFRVSSGANCAAANPQAKPILSVKVDGQRCDAIEDAPATATEACERFKAGGSASYSRTFHSDSCAGNAQWYVGAETNCAFKTNIKNATWGVIHKGRTDCDDVGDENHVNWCNREKQ